MAYAAESDAVAMYGTDYVVVSTDRNRTGSIDSTVLTSALNRATSKINGHLAGRVPLPLDDPGPVPEDVKAYCVDMAMYYASITCDVMTDNKKDLFKQAVEALKDMAKNAVSMGEEVPPINTSGTASFDSEERKFTRESLCKLM